MARSSGYRNSIRARHASWKCASSEEWNSTKSPRRSIYRRSQPSGTGSFPAPGYMTPSLPDLSRLEALFWDALYLPRDQREKFFAAQCPGEIDLQRQLQRMLAAHERAGAFLETPLPEVLASDLPRTRVARWKLLECVGEGGLGVVYRAECLEDGVRLEAAVKILRPGFDVGKFREKFVQERQILAGLDHPAIVRLMDCGADSTGRSFLVMEFVRGEPLNAY